jgi:hypothetical protein
MELKYDMVCSTNPKFIQKQLILIDKPCHLSDFLHKKIKYGKMQFNLLNGDGFIIDYNGCIKITIGDFKELETVKE